MTAMTDTTPAPWAVLVDECRLYAAGRGTAWWALTVAQFNATGRVRYLAITPSGALLEIGPLDKDDADFVRDYLAEHGVDRRVLKVRKWTEQPHLPKCRRAAPCCLCAPSSPAVQLPAA